MLYRVVRAQGHIYINIIILYTCILKNILISLNLEQSMTLLNEYYFSTKTISVYEVYEPFKFSLSDILKLNKRINNIINIKSYKQRSTPSPSNIISCIRPWYVVVHVHGISGVSVQVGDDTYRWEDKIDASLHTGESVYHDGSGLLSVNLTSKWKIRVSGILDDALLYIISLLLFFLNCLLSEVEID